MLALILFYIIRLLVVLFYSNLFLFLLILPSNHSDHLSILIAFLPHLFLFLSHSATPHLSSHGLDEPTRDLNTTLALGIISFIYIQSVTIKTRGIGSYVKDFFQPFFVMLPLNVVGKLSSIISISFRLFGNIFGGAIITKLYFSTIRGSIILELLGILSGANFLIVAFFTLFEGLLQAFVFAMLTLTYLSIGTQEGGH